MKRKYLLVLFIGGMLLLSACSLRNDAADLYKKENALQVKVAVPDVIAADEPFKVQAILSRDDVKLEKADFVHFEILKHDGSFRLPMEEALFIKEGLYEMELYLEEDGLYYLDVHAGFKGSIVNPRQQFIVGELSEAELDALKKGTVADQEMPSKHH